MKMEKKFEEKFQKFECAAITMVLGILLLLDWRQQVSRTNASTVAEKKQKPKWTKISEKFGVNYYIAFVLRSRALNCWKSGEDENK